MELTSKLEKTRGKGKWDLEGVGGGGRGRGGGVGEEGGMCLTWSKSKTISAKLRHFSLSMDSFCSVKFATRRPVVLFQSSN